MTKTHRVTLGEREFQVLTAGEVVELKDQHGDEVRIILSDIGFNRMEYAIERAKANVSTLHSTA